MKFIFGIITGVFGSIALGYFIHYNTPDLDTTIRPVYENNDAMPDVSPSPKTHTPTPTINPAYTNTTTKIDSLLHSDKLQKVYSLLTKNYYKPEDITDEKIEEWLIRGILYSVEDPYTDYFNEKQSDEFKKEMQGDFEGIGAVLEKRKKNLYITEVLKQRPAAQAGLLPGDIIIKVDDKPVINETIWETILRIRGKKGTKVTLTILRNGEEKNISITRSNIHVENVTFKLIGKKKDIAYFNISQFGNTLEDEFSKVYKEFYTHKSQNPVTGIIIDLRYNAGGLLDGAVNLASYFLPENDIIVKIQTNKGIESILRSQKLSIFSGVQKDINTPLIILVNKGTASASEIFTSALTEHKRATVVGEKTFGKGVVQQIFPLGFSNNEFVKITIAKWLTPHEKNLTNDHPIIPDETVTWDKSKMTDQEFQNKYDPQLEKAIQLLEQ